MEGKSNDTGLIIIAGLGICIFFIMLWGFGYIGTASEFDPCQNHTFEDMTCKQLAIWQRECCFTERSTNNRWACNSEVGPWIAARCKP
jgi:hypothetical protein